MKEKGFLLLPLLLCSVLGLGLGTLRGVIISLFPFSFLVLSRCPLCPPPLSFYDRHDAMIFPPFSSFPSLPPSHTKAVSFSSSFLRKLTKFKQGRRGEEREGKRKGKKLTLQGQGNKKRGDSSVRPSVVLG